MRGEGIFSDLIATRFQKGCKHFNLNQFSLIELNNKIFRKFSKEGPVQLDLRENF